ncbi:hypothetical protein DTO027B5_3185 [Paecilomyces variotii]|nr:hypothetical protein DTO027B5_3185 [Paecilomyces variotii]
MLVLFDDQIFPQLPDRFLNDYTHKFLIDTTQFSYLISPSKDLTDSITTLSPSAFDPKNQYVAVLRAVRTAATQASGGGEKVIDESSVDVKVYRVEIGASRVEYWIVALDVEGGKLVGLKAKAIES